MLAAAAAAAPLAKSSSVGTQEPPAAKLRDCGSRGEGNSPQKLPIGGVRLGPLIIWPSVRLRQSGPGIDGPWPFIQKAPVVLPARAKVVLAVAPEAISQAAFQHRGFVSAVRFEACREREPAFAYLGTVGKYTGFPFAIAIRRRSACIPMEVWIDGRATPLRRIIPVGRASC